MLCAQCVLCEKKCVLIQLTFEYIMIDNGKKENFFVEKNFI